MPGYGRRYAANGFVATSDMIIQMDWVYDNIVSFEPPPNGMVFVDRIYCLDFNAFGDADWKLLNEICNELPKRRPDSSDGCPWWFGTDESNPPYLWASVEPSGWYIHGVVLKGDWAKWDSAFRHAAQDLPRFDCG